MMVQTVSHSAVLKVRMSNKQLLLLFQLDALQIKRCRVHPPVQP